MVNRKTKICLCFSLCAFLLTIFLYCTSCTKSPLTDNETANNACSAAQAAEENEASDSQASDISWDETSAQTKQTAENTKANGTTSSSVKATKKNPSATEAGGKTVPSSRNGNEPTLPAPTVPTGTRGSSATAASSRTMAVAEDKDGNQFGSFIPV